MGSKFRIVFSDEQVPDLEEGERAAIGVITLGNYTERFTADLSFWTKDEYQGHWEAALNSIVSRTGASALITSIRNPAITKFIEWWPMWRLGSEVIFHNQLLFMHQITGPFDPSKPELFVGDRNERSEDGQEISEWRVPLSAIRRFMEHVD